MKNLSALSYCLLLSLGLVACSPTRPPTQNGKIPPEQSEPSQLDVEVRTASRASLDESTDRQSEAMRRFLMAELSMDAERPDDALSDLKASRKLIDGIDPEIQIKIASLYVRKGDLRSAIKELKDVGNDTEALALRAAVLQSSGRLPEAFDSYRLYLQKDPEAAEARLMLADEALQQKQFREAVNFLQPLVAKDSKYLPAVSLLARSHVGLGEYSQALQLLQLVRQFDPGDSQIFGMLLLSAVENADVALAEREVERETRLNPGNPVLLRLENIDFKDRNDPGLVGFITFLKGEAAEAPDAREIRVQMARHAVLRQNFPEAIEHFTLLLAQKPADDELRYSLALALSTVGKIAEATSHLEDIGSSSEWYVRAQVFSGLLYRQKGKLKESEQAFRIALRKEPKNEQLQSYLATVLREAKKFDAAKKVYQDILAADPRNENVLFSYGVLLHEMNQEKESMEVMLKLIAVNPQHAEALNFVSFAFAERGQDLDRALDLVQRAIQVQPENGFFLDTRGWVYFKMDKLKEAQSDLERAVDLSKGDAEITEHLADLFVHLKREKQAAQHYKNALDRLVDSKEDADRISAERIRKKLDALIRPVGVGTNGMSPKASNQST